MSELSKLEKRRAYMKEYNRKKKEDKLLYIKESVNEEGYHEPPIYNDTNERTTDMNQHIQIQKEKVKYLLIKPDFTLLLLNYKLHRRLMNDLLCRTAFLQWLIKYDIVMKEFAQKAKVYNEYHKKCDLYNLIFGVLEREITLPFMQWFEQFELVMTEFREAQL